MNSAAEIAERLGARKSENGWTALCPAHGDKKPSLSIGESRDRKLLLRCHAGCSFEEVVAAVAGLNKGNGKNAPKALHRVIPKGEPDAIYNYTDEAGTLLYQVLRYGHGPGKTFKYRRPDSNGEWIWNLEGVRRVPYRFSEILKADALIVVEGEKDCDALKSLGYPATNSKNWQNKWAEIFKGKVVYIIPDNDAAGKKIAEIVAKSLYGIAEAVYWIELPGLSLSGDVSDFIKAKGAGVADAEIAELITHAQKWTPEESTLKPERIFAPPSLTELSQRPKEQIEWLLYNLIPKGRVSLLSAFMKSGKSTFLGGLIASLVEGKDSLGLSTKRTPALLLTEEFSVDVFRRFQGLGLESSEKLYIHGREAGPLELQGEDMAKVKDFIRQRGIELVVVDTLSRFWTLENENDAGQVTAALKPILNLNAETGAAILLVVHDRKSEGEYGRQIRGSGALFASVDQALLLSRRQGGMSTHRLLKVIGRYPESPEELLLDFVDGRYVSLGNPQSADAQTAEQTILGVLREPITREAMEEATGLQGGTLWRALDKLVADGVVIREGTGKRGNPFTYQAREGF